MSNVKSETGGQQSRTATLGIDPSLLKAEISFWQEMIKLRDTTMTHESVERMEQALALAQTKLENSLSIAKPSQKPSGLRIGNVHFIKSRHD
jgi:hypothetical protein